MTDFWIAASALLLVALAFLLLPILRGRRARPKKTVRRSTLRSTITDCP